MSLVRATPNLAQRRNVTREYLQARVLDSLQRAGAMMPLAFHGGTALRFLYSIPRYSEDLDFALERPEADYDFRAFLRTIKSDFGAEGYEVEIKLNDQKVVHSAFVRFGGLLHELELSPHKNEVLAIKLEVDTKPPTGAVLATTITRRYVTLRLQHHNRASLLTGKLHAVLQRVYVKGRDIYDLLWYLSNPDWPAPNLEMLNNALYQTSWRGESLTSDNWREILRVRLQTLDWQRVIDDVSPFLEERANIELLTYDNLMSLLDKEK